MKWVRHLQRHTERERHIFFLDPLWRLRPLGAPYGTLSVISLSLPATVEKPSSFCLHFHRGREKIYSAHPVTNDRYRRHPGGIAGLLRVGVYNSVTCKDAMLTFEQWNLPVHLFEYYKPEAHGQLRSCFQLWVHAVLG